MSQLDDLYKNRLGEEFYAQPTLKVAKDLLGKYLVCTKNGSLQTGQILETEAYIGTEDQASHARFGKTKRNSVMWGSPGIIYVYLIYGIHHLVNIITEPENSPAAVLLRSVKMINLEYDNESQFCFSQALNAEAFTSQEKQNKTQKKKNKIIVSPIDFLQIKNESKKVSKSSFFKASNTSVLARLKKDDKKPTLLSPAKITKYFGLTTKDTGLNLNTSPELFIVDLGDKPKEIITTPRIGINYAGPIWSQKPWRFVMGT